MPQAAIANTSSQGSNQFWFWILDFGLNSLLRMFEVVPVVEQLNDVC